MRMLPVLVLVFFFKLYGMIKGASCPYETVAGSSFLGFKLKNSINSEMEIELCLTVVPLFYAVNQTEKTEFSEVNMGKLQHYCRLNFQGGTVGNLKVLNAANFRYGRIIPSQNRTALTSDIYKVEYVDQAERFSAPFHGYRISFVNGTQRFDSEECVFDKDPNAFQCQLFTNVANLTNLVSKMMKQKKPFCSIIHINDFDHFGHLQSVEMEPCEVAMRYQHMHFLCLHRAYDGCLYVKNRSPCLRDYRTGACSRSVSYVILKEPDLPYGKKCPENESFPCECSDENGDGEVYQELTCYNGGIMVFDSFGIPYCDCPFMLFGSKCQMMYGQYEVLTFFVVVTVFAFVICLTCFLRYLMQNRKACFEVPKEGWRMRLPVFIHNYSNSLPPIFKNKKAATDRLTQ